jgi:hypothetical protein
MGFDVPAGKKLTPLKLLMISSLVLQIEKGSGKLEGVCQKLDQELL